MLIQIQMNNPLKATVTTSVYKSMERNKARPYRKLEGPKTLGLDGHPTIKYADGYSADDIYPTTNHTYGDMKRMDIMVAQYLNTPLSEIDVWDWSRVTTERGKSAYTNPELKEKLARHGLIPPANINRPELVKFVIDNKLSLS